MLLYKYKSIENYR